MNTISGIMVVRTTTGNLGFRLRISQVGWFRRSVARRAREYNLIASPAKTVRNHPLAVRSAFGSNSRSRSSSLLEWPLSMVQALFSQPTRHVLRYWSTLAPGRMNLCSRNSAGGSKSMIILIVLRRLPNVLGQAMIRLAWIRATEASPLQKYWVRRTSKILSRGNKSHLDLGRSWSRL